MFRFTNHIPEFIRLLNRNEQDALKKVGIWGESKLNRYAPQDTGFLKSRNTYQIGNHYVDIGNYGCDYAIFQEFGTYKMKSHAFVKPTAFNHTNEITRIIASSFRNGVR